MIRHQRSSVIALLLTLLSSQSFAQEKSVRPGINDSFLDPNVGEWVERFEREGRELFDERNRVVRECQFLEGDHVADIGAGTGLFTRLIAPKVGEEGKVFALDISEKFIVYITESTKSLNNVVPRVCSAQSINLASRSIDTAFVCDTYHHFEYPHKTLRSIHDALRPGGTLIVIDFERVKGKSSEWTMNHVRAGKDVFRDEIEQSGFRLVEEKRFLDSQYFLRFRKKGEKNDAGHTTDSLDTVRELLKRKQAVLIDVRESGEWDEGHLKSAQLVPLSLLRDSADELPDQIKKSLPRDKVIYCHCRSGGRVLAATEILEKQGYDIRPLKAGFRSLVAEGFKVDEK